MFRSGPPAPVFGASFLSKGGTDMKITVFKYVNDENVVNWIINIDNHIKCKVDNINHVNVIYQ